MTNFKCPISVNAQVMPDNPALIHGRKIISYKDLNTLIWETCERFESVGIGEGDRVALVEPATFQHVLAILAIWRIGATACPMSTHLPEFSIEEYLTEIGAKLLLSSQDRILDIPLDSLQKVSFDYLLAQKSDAMPYAEIPIFPSDREATVILTSGSSSRPKPAVLSFGNYISNAKGANEHIPVKIKDRWLLSLPLYHVSGLGILFRVFLAGGTLVINDPDQPLDELVERYQITHLSLVPAQLQRLLDTKKSLFAFRTLKAVLIGGSPSPEPLLARALQAGLPIFLTYGLTEMASQVATSEITVCDPQSSKSIEKAIQELKTAKILNYREIKISPEKEILVKGDPLFMGYVDGSDCNLPVDSDGWFHTGDLGEIVDYHFLKISGRKDNMFISAGENIQPEEIERVLMLLEGIENAIVVPREDAALGVRPIAFLKFMAGKTLNSEKMKGLLVERLPKIKWPVAVLAWPDGAHESDAKISRESFKEILRKNPAHPKLCELN